MVEQLGLAMILSVAVNSCALISGTINFLVGSMRQAELLSITVVPASANKGASAKEVDPPAENNARWGFMEMASCADTTL